MSVSHCTNSARGTGGKATSTQRLAMVTKSGMTSSASSTKTVSPGGSSSVLRSDGCPVAQRDARRGRRSPGAPRAAGGAAPARRPGAGLLGDRGTAAAHDVQIGIGAGEGGPAGGALAAARHRGTGARRRTRTPRRARRSRAAPGRGRRARDWPPRRARPPPPPPATPRRRRARGRDGPAFTGALRARHRVVRARRPRYAPSAQRPPASRRRRSSAPGPPPPGPGIRRARARREVRPRGAPADRPGRARRRPDGPPPRRR